MNLLPRPHGGFGSDLRTSASTVEGNSLPAAPSAPVTPHLVAYKWTGMHSPNMHTKHTETSDIHKSQTQHGSHAHPSQRTHTHTHVYMQYTPHTCNKHMCTAKTTNRHRHRHRQTDTYTERCGQTGGDGGAPSVHVMEKAGVRLSYSMCSSGTAAACMSGTRANKTSSGSVSSRRVENMFSLSLSLRVWALLCVVQLECVCVCVVFFFLAWFCVRVCG